MSGEELKAWCKAKGIRQKELAERLGVAENTVSRWVKGSLPTPPLLRRALRDVEAELKRETIPSK